VKKDQAQSRNTQTQQRILLVFAHKAEAQAFMAGSERLSDSHYSGPSFDICLSGEGRQNVSEVLSAQLSRVSYSKVINLGCVASLTDRYKVMEITEVAVVYQHIHQKAFEYRSFNLDGAFSDSSSFPAICISLQERLKADQAMKEYLSFFADVADRELWAVASVCKRHQIPLAAVKIVSDDTSQSCQSVRDRAQELSLRLYEYLHASTLLETQAIETDPLKDFPFYATLSQKQRLKRLLTFVKADRLQNLVAEIEQKSVSSKQKTSLLISTIEKDFYV
jgi:nucleoside phosphorylase